MGLDNGFEIRKKSDKTVIEIAYFRKYYELRDFICERCTRVDEESDFLFKVDIEDLKELLIEIEPIAKVLIQYSDKQLHHYDDVGYPEKSALNSEELKCYDGFNPIYTTSAFAGWKLLRLYHAVKVMIDFFEDYASKDYYLTFYNSY